MKTTLQARLISLLVLSSLFLVSAFTAIQLNNQMDKTREFNVYQARQEAFMARSELQRIFAPNTGPGASAISQNAALAEAKRVLSSLLGSGAIETASIIDRDSRPVMLEGNLKLFFEDDRAFIDGISTSGDETKWMVPLVDKEHRIVNLYVKFNNPFGYILKITLSLGNVQKALNAVYAPVAFTVAIVIVGNIILGGLLSWALISPIKVLNEATKDVASGNLDLKVHISTKDELEELSETFNYMTAELKKMKAKAENANPLTKLPGNIVIREEVEKRINEAKKFVLIYCDLDNFKVFNDKYGVHAGDEAIMLTADICKEAIAKEAKGDGFIGHEGGDDFLILTTPEYAEKVAGYITEEFDKRIKRLYHKDDLERGYIEARSRYGEQIIKFPVMSISLAGVTNLKKEIASYAQLTNIAADVKKATKKLKGSNFVMDRRIVEGAEHVRKE